MKLQELAASRTDTDAFVRQFDGRAGDQFASPVLTWGVRALALVAAVVAVAGTALLDDDATPIAFVMIGVMVLPWLLEIAGGAPPRPLYAALVLGPPAGEMIVALLVHGSDLWQQENPFSFGTSSTYLPMVLLISLAFSPRRLLVAVSVATVLIYLARGIVAGDGLDVVFSMVALTFAIGACAGIRLGAVGIARAQRIAVARDAVDRRRQIARDVHDVVAHTLAVTMLHVTAARMALLRADTVDAVEALEEAERSGRSSLTDVRRIVRLLRSDTETALDAAQPQAVDVPGLVETFRAAGLVVAFDATGQLDAVSPTAGFTLYRVVQEALANAARHGEGSTVVELHADDGAVELDVRNPIRLPVVPTTGGSGVRGMRERVEAAGGTITVGPDGGEWRVHVLGVGAT